MEGEKKNSQKKAILLTGFGFAQKLTSSVDTSLASGLFCWYKATSFGRVSVSSSFAD